MENNQAAEDRKGFLQNDRRLVCSMFVFYGICIIGAIVATFWALDGRRKTISANATSTAYAVATQHANTTATAVVRSTEQGQYEFIERFDAPSNLWLYGPEKDEYWIGQISIKDGVYIWDANQVKQTFVYWSDFHKENTIKDFDIYMDTKFVEGIVGGVCGGFVFRKAPGDWENGAYTFSVCNDSYFQINYYLQGEWEIILDWEYSNVIQHTDWNRLEISARGNNFTFTINNMDVFEMKDDRREMGGLAILFEVKETDPAVVWFDNFGYQSR